VYQCHLNPSHVFCPLPVYCVIITGSGENNRLSLRCQKLLLWPVQSLQSELLKGSSGGFITVPRPPVGHSQSPTAEEPKSPLLSPRRGVSWAKGFSGPTSGCRRIVYQYSYRRPATTGCHYSRFQQPICILSIHLPGRFECVIELIAELKENGD